LCRSGLDDGDRKVFLLALRDVATACGGMTKLARQAKLNRENLYRMLSESGNPGLAGLGGLLDAMGLRLAIEAK
jgi:probable addiction module antidote protein